MAQKKYEKLFEWHQPVFERIAAYEAVAEYLLDELRDRESERGHLGYLPEEDISLYEKYNQFLSAVSFKLEDINISLQAAYDDVPFARTRAQGYNGYWRLAAPYRRSLYHRYYDGLRFGKFSVEELLASVGIGQ